jgi:hypothetical protein
MKELGMAVILSPKTLRNDEKWLRNDSFEGFFLWQLACFYWRVTHTPCLRAFLVMKALFFVVADERAGDGGHFEPKNVRE